MKKIDLNSGIEREPINRRKFLRTSITSGVVLTVGAATGAASEQAFSKEASSSGYDSSPKFRKRAAKAAALKIDSAKQRYIESKRAPKQKRNNDEARYKKDRFIASFSKALPCNQYGEVEPSAFRKLRRALKKRKEVGIRCNTTLRIQ